MSSSSGKTPSGDVEDKVFQFHVRLVNTMPPVWRRVQVPATYKFWGLHCVIQNSMGWNDHHLFQFHIQNPKNGKFVKIGKPIEQGESWSVDETTQQSYMDSPAVMLAAFEQIGIDYKSAQGMFASWKVPLTKYYGPNMDYETNYIYDFGDRWLHEVKFEGVFPADPDKIYPVCIAGERACPPEDCGGTFAFDELLDNLKKDPSDRTKEEKEKIDWLHNDMKMQDFDPNYFDPSSVLFVNPKGWLAYRRTNTVDALIRDLPKTSK